MTSSLEEQIRSAEERFLEIWSRGPADLTWTELPPQVGDLAPDLRLPDSTGTDRLLSEFWTDRPALVLFWRHYGCGCGVDRAARLRDEMQGYLDAGANVVIVGQGEPERAAAYARTYGLTCPILCDTSAQAYDAYGLREGQVAQLLFDAPEEMWHPDRESGLAFQQKRRDIGRPLVDNPWLLPGEFVVDTSGTIRLTYRYQYCEDFPNPLVLVTAIKQAQAGGAPQ